MFKCLLVLCALGLALAKPQNSAEEIIAKMAEAYQNCKQGTELTEETFKKILKENGEIDEKFKNFNVCLYNTFNMFDAAGKLDKARFESVINMVYPEKIGAIMQECIQEGPDTKEVALMISRCIGKHVL
ncbi:unnamed protein product [Phyllotreta striolata]|uniref:Uncharacterized protein n=1 Tax=Phyllotreta striolata TaxID=444603 RepID=A0A9N9XNX7_PHYSR|nr:unnamed protein product [Phyllotreta striolata]